MQKVKLKNKKKALSIAISPEEKKRILAKVKREGWKSLSKFVLHHALNNC